MNRGDGNATNTSKYAGVLYNHFQWCAWKKLNLERLNPQTLEAERRIQARLTMLSYASEDNRSVNTVFYIDRIKSDWWPINLSPAQVQVSIQASCRVTCNVSPSPAKRTLADMALTPTEIQMQSPEQPTSTNPSAITKGGLVFEISAEFDGYSGRTTPGYFEDDVRCDSANLTRNEFTKSACVFSRVGGTFSLNEADDGVDQSAKHIREAISNPNMQPPKPPNNGTKTVPWVLTRHWNTTLRNQQRDRSRRSCEEIPDRPANTDCDEFPFATTLEGSLAGPNPRPPGYINYNYSVRYIDSADNRRSGCWLGRWYVKDRILEGDKFSVSIYGGPPAAEDPAEIVCEDES